MFIMLRLRNLCILLFLWCYASVTIAWSSNKCRTRRYSANVLQMKDVSIHHKWKQILSSAAVGISLSFGVTSTPQAKADSIPAVGQQAPSFQLPSTLGKDISLEDLKGKRTVLYFYPADFTSGCTLEAQYFERDYDKYKDLNVQLVGVSVDSVEKHLDFRKKCQLDFPLLSDKNGDISNKYGSLLNLGFVGKFSNRQTYIISPESKIEYVFTDVDGNLSSHSGDVLAKLQELQQLK